MSQHDDAARLRHMIDYAREAVQMCEGCVREDLDRDRMLNLSLVRLIEIVGEAASRVSEALQLAHPEVPWRKIAGTRNRLVHGYDDVNFDILWNTIQDDLPPLIDQLQTILADK